MPNQIFRHARRGIFLGFLPLAAFTLAGETSAQAKTKAERALEIGASERVNYSGKLRMLSQRVVAAGCNYAAGVDPEKSGGTMHAAKSEFNKIIHALEHGDPDLGINGAEKRKKTIRRIGMVHELWDPVSEQLDTLSPNGNDAPLVATLADESGPLLEMAKLLVVDLSAQYSDPNALLQSHAILVDISGRQRMLAQRMSKNVCLLASGIRAETASSELMKTAEIFETSLFALRSGMLSVGIVPPPNDIIADGLDVVVSDWKKLKPFVAKVLDGGEMSSTERATVFHGMNQMTGNMNKVVGHYSDASKLGGT